MKRIVRGNDFNMRIPVVKIVEGEKVAFPLPGCTDIVVRLCSAYRRLELAHTIDAKEDNVIVARVEGDRIPFGTYALEVRGKIFGNDWRSNEYEQVAIVDRNADADTELGNTDEGEDSVEMDTAVVVLPPDRELDALVKEALAQNKAMSELSDAIKVSEEGRAKSEELRAKSEEARVQAELTRANSEAERVQAEQVRESAENARADAENARVEAENTRVTAENARITAEAVRVTAEGERADAEGARTEAEAARQEAEKKREASEVTRTRTETERETNEQARQEAETVRKEAETARKEAESEREAQEQARVKNEEGRVKSENARAQAEAARVTAESARVDAENTRVTAEGERVTAEGEREQGFTEKAAHLEELLQYIKDNHLEVDAKLAEAIKNTIKGTDVFVYLDGNDGNVKSMPNTGRLGPSAAAVYYAGKRSVMPGESYMVIGYQKNELIRSFDLSGWDFEAATDMTRFLYFASGLQTLTLPENVMLGNVTNMSQCFYECRHLLSLDTSKWTLANVTDMNGCFYGCGSLQSLDTSKWTLANVTNMNACFYDCESLREIDLSSCNITKCRNWDHCFTTLDNLETLRIGLIDFSPCGSIDLFMWGTNPRELTGTLRGIRNDFRAVSSRMTRDSCMVVINGLEMVTEAKTLTLGVNNKPVSLGGKGSDPISDDDLKIATDKGWTVQFG